jgi:putative DNA primase/helicase
VLPPGATVAVALWTVHAHAHEAAEVNPFLAIVSPVMRCGKTTLLRVLGQLVPRMLATSNITPAAIFRTVDRFRPTLLIDEADTFIRQSSEMRGILDGGHTRRTASIVRTTGEQHEARQFSTWCPKAIALIGRLPATLQDRSIVIPMKRREPGEYVERFRERKLADLDPLSRRAARWAKDHFAKLRSADPLVPDALDDRAADNWRPLLAIADAAGGDWPRLARGAALRLSGSEQRLEDSLGTQLLGDIKTIFDDQPSSPGTASGRISSADLIAALVAAEDRPWSTLNARQLAQHLAPFDIAPKQLRLGDMNVRGYERAQFDDAFARYLGPPPAEALHPLHAPSEAGTGGTDEALQGDAVADGQRHTNSDGERAVAVVAGQPGRPRQKIKCPLCGNVVPLRGFDEHWAGHDELEQPAVDD